MASLNSCPTVKVMWVVRTVVEVLMDRVSPSCVISTSGLDAAFTAITRIITFTPSTRPAREETGSLLNQSTLEQNAGCSLSLVQPRCQRKQ